MNSELRNENNGLKGQISFALTGIFYLLFNVSIDPERMSVSLTGTLFHLLGTAPLVAAITFALVVFLNRLAGERLPWNRIIRIYFTIGIIVGFLYGLSGFWVSKQ